MTRAELYALVWEMPAAHVAQRVGISHARLRKICLDYNIPIPPPGYWTKLAHGKAVQQPSLPQAPTFLSKINSALRRLGEVPLQIADIQLDDFDLKFDGPSPTSDGALHGCASLLAEALSGAVADEDGFLIVSGPALPIVRVGPQSAKRAVLLMDSFARTLLVRGHQIVQQDDGLRVVVEEEIFHLKIYETRDKLKDETTSQGAKLRAEDQPGANRPGGSPSSPKWTYRPSGHLCMEIFDPRPFRWSGRNLVGQWHDRRSRPVEESLGEAIAATAAAAALVKHCRARAQEQAELVEADALQRTEEQARLGRARRETDFLEEKADAYVRFLNLKKFAEFLASETDRSGAEPVDRMARALADLVMEFERQFSPVALNDELQRRQLFTDD